ncbi:MAG: HlyD family efflux transporter periplasmic adaptor subunit [Methyloceanibacter sp.]|nr:HlyD family efflux transporter periplasmic adaptor subunit [Methyloceanibacter sp.]
MGKWWIWLLGIAVLVLAAALVLFDDEPTEVVTVDARQIHPEIVARARVDAAQGVSKVRSLVDGKLQEVLVYEGDTVEQGKLVAVIDNPTLKAELQRSEADLRVAEAELATVIEGMRPEEREAHDAAVRAVKEELDKAQAELNRKTQLFERGHASRSDMDDAILWVRDAEARLDQARAEARLAHAGGRASEIQAAQERVGGARAALERAQATFSHTRLVAPSAGTVVARRGNPGDIVFPDATQTPIVEIADLSALEIRIEVEQMDAHELKAGLKVRLRDVDNRTSVGDCVVSRVGRRLQPRSIGAEDARLRASSQVRTLWCRAKRDLISRPLLLDQRLEAVIVLPAIDAPATIPREAVYVERGQAYVDRPGRFGATRTAVTLGARDSERIAVTGLEAGDSVLVPEAR